MKVKESIREKRRKKTAEVFTPPDLIVEILERIPEDSWEEDKTFCDPSAGNGNFLVAVYMYKVEICNHDPTKALKTIYGVELQEDNVEEMKHKLFKISRKYGVAKEEARRTIDENIVCADALNFDWDFSNKNNN